MAHHEHVKDAHHAAHAARLSDIEDQHGGLLIFHGQAGAGFGSAFKKAAMKFARKEGTKAVKKHGRKLLEDKAPKALEAADRAKAALALLDG